jgi:hypothetical protein
MSRRKGETKAEYRAYLAKADRENARVEAKIAKQKREGTYVNIFDITADELGKGLTNEQIGRVRLAKGMRPNSDWVWSYPKEKKGFLSQIWDDFFGPTHASHEPKKTRTRGER